MGFEGFQESNVATGTAGVSPAAIIQQNWLMQKIARANALVAGETPAVPVKRSSASRTELTTSGGEQSNRLSSQHNSRMAGKRCRGA